MHLQPSGFWLNHPLNQANVFIKANGALIEVADLKRYIVIVIITFRVILDNNIDLPKNTDVASVNKILIIDSDLESPGSDLQ